MIMTLRQVVKEMHRAYDKGHPEVLGDFHQLCKVVKVNGLAGTLAVNCFDWDEAYEIVCAEYLDAKEQLEIQQLKKCFNVVHDAIYGCITGAILSIIWVVLRYAHIL